VLLTPRVGLIWLRAISSAQLSDASPAVRALDPEGTSDAEAIDRHDVLYWMVML
jgi:hypothetical protein